jgi:hypothetical protein
MTLLVQELVEEHAPALTRKALAEAYQGDRRLLQLFLERILPRPKDSLVRLGRLPMRTTKELLQSHEILTKKVASGQVTPGQAQQIDALIERRRLLIETHEHDARIQAIEELNKKDSDKVP